MKKLILFVFVLSFYHLAFNIENCSAQSGWFQLNSGTSEVLYSTFFTDANTGYVTGVNGTALKTTNAGVNWFSQTVPTTYQLRYVFFTDVNTGYIASGGMTTSVGNVYKTTNGGNSWNALTLPSYAHFYSIFFTNFNTGYVTGHNIILKTTNTGITWTSNSSFALGYITSIDFVDANTGFATAFNATVILKTTNAGNNWQEAFNGGIHNNGFFGIDFIDANTGVAVGGNPFATGDAFILRTTNGGLNWSNCNFNNSNIYRLWSVRFLSPSIGYIAGGGYSGGIGAILKTTNGGVNWYFQTTNVDSALHGNYFTSVNTGYVVGSNGRILKTTDGGGTLLGINPESNQIPEQFSLSQNYPNPFNPFTVIRYQLSVKGFVTIKIYDIFGKEVKQLINNELKQAGNYSIEFYGLDLSSGIYFYQLQVEGKMRYSETRKMILLK